MPQSEQQDKDGNEASTSTSGNTLGLEEGAPKTDESERREESRIRALEEDDEFEEFPVQDWDDSQTDLAHLGDTSGSGKAPDKLWEDTWDDDDVEDDFSQQLRNELAKKGSAGSGEPMKH